MVFSSLTFISVFLPIVLILHTVIPSIKVKNALLLVASLVFYAYGEPVYVLLLIASCLMNYAFAFGAGCKNKKVRKLLLVLNVIANIGILAVFKYSDMFVSTLNGAFGLSLPLPEIRLPIGISFFTFQAMSYTIDVYRGATGIQKNPFKLTLYISLFPQLIAGPIVKYRDIEERLSQRTVDINSFKNGIERFIMGLSKKVIFANTLGLVADSLYSASFDKINILSAWLAAVSYMLQIYYDFSGYSDMAIGLGKTLGFDFKENFNYPYISDSITDFWRRWHISLSTWFKEYLYIPLGGNRKGKIRTDINKLIVFFFTGLWHGASWTFVAWGAVHGLFSVLELHCGFIKKLPKIVKRIYTLLVVCFAFVLFRADTFTQAGVFMKNMFAGYHFDSACMSLALEQLTPWFIFVFILALVCVYPLQQKLVKIVNAFETKHLLKAIKSVSLLALLAFCMIRISSGSYNPFIYFRF